MGRPLVSQQPQGAKAVFWAGMLKRAKAPFYHPVPTHRAKFLFQAHTRPDYWALITHLALGWMFQGRDKSRRLGDTFCTVSHLRAWV